MSPGSRPDAIIWPANDGPPIVCLKPPKAFHRNLNQVQTPGRCHWRKLPLSFSSLLSHPAPPTSCLPSGPQTYPVCACLRAFAPAASCLGTIPDPHPSLHSWPLLTTPVIIHMGLAQGTFIRPPSLKYTICTHLRNNTK